MHDSFREKGAAVLFAFFYLSYDHYTNIQKRPGVLQPLLLHCLQNKAIPEQLLLTAIPCDTKEMYLWKSIPEKNATHKASSPQSA